MDKQRLTNRLSSLRTLAAQLPDGGMIKPQMIQVLGLMLTELNLEGVESLDQVSGQSPAWRIGYEAGLRHAASLRLIESTQARVDKEKASQELCGPGDPVKDPDGTVFIVPAGSKVIIVPPDNECFTLREVSLANGTKA